MEFMYDYRHPDIKSNDVEWLQGVVAWNFESFELDSWNLIKIQIPHSDGNIEPAWVYVSTVSKMFYDKKKSVEIVPCVLRNSSRYFPLGAYIPLELDGTQRPMAKMKYWVGGCYFHPDEQQRLLKDIYNRGKRDAKTN